MCGIFAVQAQGWTDELLKDAFHTLQHRGPDQSQWLRLDAVHVMGFHRLAIMDTSAAGLQPFRDACSGDALICNGEIYNFENLRHELSQTHNFRSHSDCEVLLPLIHKIGLTKAVERLDAEFALIYYDAQSHLLMAARDPLGIRPLFYGYGEETGSIAFASEAKALHSLCRDIFPFPPGYVFDGYRFQAYRSVVKQAIRSYPEPSATRDPIRAALTTAVEKRLHADRPLGCLLSGGLDSSLVAALATRLRGQPITTFAVGCEVDPIDMKYAALVAEHIGSDHHEVYFNHDDVIALLEEVIAKTETWDVTTIRASIGMYIVCRYIRKQTEIRVLLTGEVSDELFGYKYTDYAPDAAAFQAEAQKRLGELYLYDVLRADRCIAAHGLEARVPFGDLDFVDTVMAIDPELKRNRYGIGKYLLRQAFEGDDLLPRSILMREKAAVGHSMVDTLKAYAAALISDQDMAVVGEEFPYATPFTKESLLYRRIFNRLYPGRERLIPDFWMPNPTWSGCQVNDPSARFLANYGASGH
jgi:asparagine synthase (glutamine-hydrolysing)